MKKNNRLILPIIVFCSLISSKLFAKLPKNGGTQSQQIEQISGTQKTQKVNMDQLKVSNQSDPNQASGHANVLGFAQKEVTWGLLRDLTKNKEGKTIISNPKLKNILGKNIKLKGFMLPLDFSKKQVAEFLLLPYIPSCMHVPPPPSSQIILVKMPKGQQTTQTYFPVEVEGIIRLDENKEYESSYLMSAKKVTEVKKESKRKK